MPLPYKGITTGRPNPNERSPPQHFALKRKTAALFRKRRIL